MHRTVRTLASLCSSRTRYSMIALIYRTQATWRRCTDPHARTHLFPFHCAAVHALHTKMVVAKEDMIRETRRSSMCCCAMNQMRLHDEVTMNKMWETNEEINRSLKGRRTSTRSISETSTQFWLKCGHLVNKVAKKRNVNGTIDWGFAYATFFASVTSASTPLNRCGAMCSNFFSCNRLMCPWNGSLGKAIAAITVHETSLFNPSNKSNRQWSSRLISLTRSIRPSSRLSFLLAIYK